MESTLKNVIRHIQIELDKEITGVYIHPPQETRYPYVLFDLHDTYENGSAAYIKGDIIVLSNQPSVQEILNLSKRVKYAVQSQVFKGTDHAAHCVVEGSKLATNLKANQELTHTVTLAFQLSRMQEAAIYDA